jgi:hypothetical protein
VKFNGTVSFGDLLVGYHQQLGALDAEAYAGAMASRHVIDPFDPEASVQGSGIGGKTVLETWWTLGEHAWASLDVSYGTLHDTYGWQAASRLADWRRLCRPASRWRPTATPMATPGVSVPSCATSGRRARSRIDRIDDGLGRYREGRRARCVRDDRLDEPLLIHAAVACAMLRPQETNNVRHSAGKVP